jgi:hypothetical protein
VTAVAGLRRRLSEFEEGIREEVERLVKIELHLMLEVLQRELDEELFVHICRLLTEVEDPVPDRYRRGGRDA